eukprot:479856-Amphidinium_carterae.1
MTKQLNKLQPVDVPTSKTRPASAAATPTEISSYRALLGGLMWCCRCTCAHGLAACSIMAAKATRLTIQDMKDLNKELSKIKATNEDIKVIGIPPSRGGYTVYVDSSFANREDQRTQ